MQVISTNTFTAASKLVFDQTAGHSCPDELTQKSTITRPMGPDLPWCQSPLLPQMPSGQSAPPDWLLDLENAEQLCLVGTGHWPLGGTPGFLSGSRGTDFLLLWLCSRPVWGGVPLTPRSGGLELSDSGANPGNTPGRWGEPYFTIRYRIGGVGMAPGSIQIDPHASRPQTGCCPRLGVTCPRLSTQTSKRSCLWFLR